MISNVIENVLYKIINITFIKKSCNGLYTMILINKMTIKFTITTLAITTLAITIKRYLQE